MNKHTFALALLATVLGGCGGSNNTSSLGSGGVVSSGDIIADGGFLQNQNVDLVLLSEQSSISDIQWQQTLGPSVNLLADKSKAISFKATNTGNYAFTVTYSIAGEQKSDDIEFTVEQASPKLRLSRGHSVVEGGNVSLRVFASDGIDQNSIRFEQVSGPSIQFDDENVDSQLAIFTAPSVSRDAVIEIEVSAEADNGEVHRDNVIILVENTPTFANDPYFDEPLANVYVYNPTSPYRNALIDCVYSNALNESCPLGNLPILASDSNGATPTIEQIMDRLVVSHDWMAENFRLFLETYDDHDDFKNLLRATTAIVLSYDIRPSFYWAATGAIYLDPENLWLTSAQRETINEAPDYRANFGSDLQFVIPWRYVINNEYATLYYPPEYELSRNLNDLHFELSDLLYHELAHANDYLPPNEWNTYSDNTSFLAAALDKREISENLTAVYPTTSNEMKQLAAVRFRGETATSTQRNYRPEDVASFYEPDNSNGFYNYTSEREDLAILFEELMMALRFGVQRDTAVTSPAVYDSEGNLLREQSYIVAWGQRGRISERKVSVRANYVTERLLPEVDLSLVDDLPSPVPMAAGKNWWDNLQISNAIPAPLQSLRGQPNSHLRPLEGKVRYHRPHLPALPSQ
ncbi:hypothetical protein [Thalassotalea maritima]|uniref:hypothetical protein n=1 Tax=Thalassotalea maritima TaxID=3242416 RepID=UPI00352944D2